MKVDDIDKWFLFAWKYYDHCFTPTIPYPLPKFHLFYRDCVKTMESTENVSQWWCNESKTVFWVVVVDQSFEQRSEPVDNSREAVALIFCLVMVTWSLIHSVQLYHIFLSESITLTESRDGAVQGNDRRVPVLWKRFRTVMHDRLVVVRSSIVGDNRLIILMEIVFMTIGNIFPNNLHMIVTVRCALLVIETSSVQHLVHHDAFLDALWRVNIQLLAAFSFHSNRRPATCFVSGDKNPIDIGWLIRLETQTSSHVKVFNRW